MANKFSNPDTDRAAVAALNRARTQADMDRWTGMTRMAQRMTERAMLDRACGVIRVIYTSIDGCRETRRFKTLPGARRFAQKRVGETPDMGSCYAVSDDGVGKVQCAGCLLLDLFPRLQDVAAREVV